MRWRSPPQITYVSVHESEKAAFIAVTAADGTSQILRQPMSDSELVDYKAHPEAYFGKRLPVSKGIKMTGMSCSNGSWRRRRDYPELQFWNGFPPLEISLP
jgi:hypothetical protein